MILEPDKTAVNPFTDKDYRPTEEDRTRPKVVGSSRYNAGERYNLLIMCPYCSRRYAYKVCHKNKQGVSLTCSFQETMKHHIHSVHTNPDGSIKDPISVFSKNISALQDQATVTEEATVEPAVEVKQEPMDDFESVEVIETPVPEATRQEKRIKAGKTPKKHRTPDWRAMPVTGINNKTDHRSKFKIYNKKTMKLVGKDGKRKCQFLC